MKKLIEIIAMPFESLAVLIDESRRINEDGSWDKYHARKNCKAELRELKAQYKADKAATLNKWGIAR